MDLATLAALLGHSKLAMVTRYAHPTEAHQFEAVKKLQAFMGRKAA
jgi:site-specific recombinase XerD